MKILNTKFQRDIMLSKGMLISIIAIIAVGIGCFTGMLSTFENLKKAKIEYYSQCRMADFWITLKKAPISEVKQLLQFQGISEIRHRIRMPVIVDIENIERPIGGLLLSLPEKYKPILNNIYMQRGSYFSNNRRNDVIISEKFALARNIKIGSFLNIIVGGQKRRFFVVGTAISSEHMYLTPPGSIASSPGEYGIFFIKQKYAEDILNFQGACNNIIGLFTPKNRKNSQSLLKKIDKKLDSYGVFSTTPRKLQFSHLTLTAEMGGLQSMATMLPIIFLGVAALILNVLMIRLAQQQRTIVGTLKALGYSNRQIFSHFLKYALFVGVFGGIAGCILGQWISYEMTKLYKTLFEFPRLLIGIYPGIMLIAIIISIVFSILGTLKGVKQVIKLSPAEAMREKMPEVGGAIFIERIKWFWSRLDFRWQMILRNFFVIK